jgi:hypothetical protein
MKSEKEKKLKQHLYKYYDVLNWGEELEIFLSENFKLYNEYDGKLLEFTEKEQIIGGLVLYFNHKVNSHVIGLAAIDPLHRGKGYFKNILTIFCDIYPRLYLFSQIHLVTLYSQFFKYQKQIPDMNIYLFSNYETIIEDKGPFF